MNIIWKMPNGAVGLTKIYNLDGCKDHFEFAAKLKEQKLVPNDWVLVALNKDLPSDKDHDYFDAWVFDEKTQKVKVCLDRAKEVHKNCMRVHRNQALQKLDGQFLQAMELGNEAAMAEIKTKKQRMRDFPSTVDSVQSLDELRAISVVPEI